MSSLGPDPPPLFGSPRFSGWEEKYRRGDSTTGLGRGDETAAGERLSGQTLEGRPSAGGQENGCPCVCTFPGGPRAAPTHCPTHRHDKPQSLCSSQGVCFWDNPAPRRKKKTYGSMHGRGQERASEPSVFSDRWLLTPLRPPTPFRPWGSRASRAGDQGTWLSRPGLQAAPTPPSGSVCVVQSRSSTRS